MGRRRRFRLVKAERAATQVELILVAGDRPLELWTNGAVQILPFLLSRYDTCFAKNTQVFGDIILCHFQPLSKFANRERSLEQLLHNAPPSLVPQGFQHSNARCLLRHGLSFCTGHAGRVESNRDSRSP